MNKVYRFTSIIVLLFTISGCQTSQQLDFTVLESGLAFPVDEILDDPPPGFMVITSLDDIKNSINEQALEVLEPTVHSLDFTKSFIILSHRETG